MRDAITTCRGPKKPAQVPGPRGANRADSQNKQTT